jgi:hypothetical protein
VGGRHLLARRVPRPSAARFRRSGLRPEFNADAGDGFLARIASAARTRHSSGVQTSPDDARASPGRNVRARSNRFGLRSDAMMADDAVGVRPSKQEARRAVYGAATAPRMARGSNNLADKSKPLVGVANI